jgi:glyoxylase-like metal-dependent hydrolase (beta-lactamase superfamily II)
MLFLSIYGNMQKVNYMRILNLGNITNCYLLEINDKCLLLDTGYPAGYPSFRKKLNRLGLSPSNIEYIFLTHAHDDHAGFLNELLRDSNAKFILHQNAIEGLRRGQNSFAGFCSGRLALFFCKLMALAGHGEHRFPPVEARFESRFLTVNDETKPALEAELGAKIIETPGHTACSISLMTDGGILFCGDAAMNGIPSLKRATIWMEDREAFCASWKKIIELNPKMLYPGHGRPFPVSDLARFLPKAEKRKLFVLS